MAWARLSVAALLSLQCYSCWPHTADIIVRQLGLTDGFDHFGLKGEERLQSETDSPAADHQRRRSKREQKTTKVSTTPMYTTLPQDRVTSTENMNVTHSQVTMKATTKYNYKDERSTLQRSTRPTHLFTAPVPWIDTRNTGMSTITVSEAPVAGTDKQVHLHDTNQTSAWNCQRKKNESYVMTHSDYVSYAIASAMKTYAQPILSVVGMVGNTVSMCVMFQRNNRQTSFGIYLGMLAVSDLLTLCSMTVYSLARVLYSPQLRDIDCQIRGWSIHSLHMYGFCLIFGLTVDRLIAVRFPLKAVVWCHPRRAKLVAGATFIVAWLVNSPFYVYNHVESCNICAMVTRGSVVSRFYPWIVVFVGLVVPFVSLVSMNAVIAIAIRNRLPLSDKYIPERRREITEPMELTDNQASSGKYSEHSFSRDSSDIRPMSSRDRNAVVTLFLVSFAFLLLVTPHFVHIATFSMPDGPSKLSDHAEYTLFFQISRLLYSFNNSCNFFLYCLSGAKFRSEVVRLFRPKACTE